MKRFLIGVLILAFVVAIPLSTTLMAGKQPKVDVCHLNSANDVLDLGTQVIAFGKVINVSEKAVAHHVKHGDSTEFFPMTEELRDILEEFFEIKLPNANCYFLK